MVGLVSLALPTNDASHEERFSDERWRYVYGFPLVVHAISYVFIYASLKNPSLKELIKNKSPSK